MTQARDASVGVPSPTPECVPGGHADVQEPGRALAIDPGTRRIGVAVSDPLRVVARPLCTVARRSDEDAVERLVAIAQEVGATIVIVGHPLLPSGERGASARRAERFARTLAAHLVAPVQLWDESYTTEAATDRRRELGAATEGPSRRTGIDAEAAAVILQEWMAAQDEGREEDRADE